MNDETVGGVDHSDAAGGGGVFDLVFEVGREEGSDQLGTIVRPRTKRAM